MKLPKEVIKIYFVSDPKGSYWFWLNKSRVKYIQQAFS